MHEPEPIPDVAVRDPASDLERMLADAVLSPGLVPVRDVWHRHAPVSGGLRDARRVLLTGATGFLGRWLANELLTGSESTLVCVVRRGQGDARERLGAVLAATGIDASTFALRVRVVEGDLSRRWLGMSATAFASLAHEVDAVCHAGALVNWVRPYAALKSANVDSTRDLLDLACRRSLPFHFVSSLSVCYSTTIGSGFPRRTPAISSATAGGAIHAAPPVINEHYDALPDLSGLHLGYAQTKVVAEALVREAGRRGLPISIYRPSLIAGHSRTGAFNSGDILARVVSGCVRMGTAPDLDWTLDCLPVDTAARRIVDLSSRRGTIHLRHAQPRHWRECVLWMRLYGYDIRLVPYHAWLHQLERETEGTSRTHPLRPLRSFLLGRPAGARGRTQPELLLGSDRQFQTTVTEAAADPPLDAPLLQRYFAAFVGAGVLPAVARPGRAPGPDGDGMVELSPTSPGLDTAFFSNAMDAVVCSAEPLGRLSDHSIVSELTSWNSNCATGLFRYRLRGHDRHGDRFDRRVVVKTKARDHEVIAVGEALARLCDDRIGDAYARSALRIGLVASDARELAVYGQSDARFTRHAPVSHGAVVDATSGICTIVLEHIVNARLKDSVNQPGSWTAVDIDCAISGLAALHAIWFGREAALRAQPWIGHVPSTATTADMSDLWQAMAAHAAPRFSAWAGPAIAQIQRRLADHVEQWWRPLEALPRTLIHNDFNPRNICIRESGDEATLLAYDWELAAIGVPQHDLAEFLCFVLPDDASDSEIDWWVERHRERLQQETGVVLDRADWREGFRAALHDLMLNRIPTYALIHRVRRQPFLPRIVRTWRRLYERFPLELPR